ncbi:hypothetical protein WJX72_012392 [[Myrmecia] bisecta]|uniref:SOUL heme-binding protein n=1 Tax=[Myrmecia] bisecta TaxID=41462 RepID=A0AAW1QUC9_9CHLO
MQSAVLGTVEGDGRAGFVDYTHSSNATAASTAHDTTNSSSTAIVKREDSDTTALGVQDDSAASPFSEAAVEQEPSASTSEQQNQALLEETQQFLEAELQRIFSSGQITRERYMSSFTFEDPVSRYGDLNGFMTNIRLLRTLFDIRFDLHKSAINKPMEIVTRWTMTMKVKAAPWRPALTFTGRSYYGVNLSTGKLTYQKDMWDAVADNRFLSVEGVAHVVQQLTSLQTTPSLDTPPYTVLKKTREYEIRKYKPYLVAETDMPSGSGPAAGDGFNTLAGYIFGGNDKRAKMEMTTPVISTGGQPGPEGGKMQFPMENKYGGAYGMDVAESGLPNPNSERVVRKLQEGGIIAATTFPGLPLDFEVVQAERRLRGALLVDGLKAQEGYRLARYNDPFTLPFLRRNEVLISLEDFELETAERVAWSETR